MHKELRSILVCLACVASAKGKGKGGGGLFRFSLPPNLFPPSLLRLARRLDKLTNYCHTIITNYKPRVFHVCTGNINLRPCICIERTRLARSVRQVSSLIIESLSNEDGNVNKIVKNDRLSYRVQSVHVGMQPSGHFSAVVFRNRM